MRANGAPVLFGFYSRSFAFIRGFCFLTPANPKSAMPTFRYQAIDHKGRGIKGMMPAHDESNLEQKLRAIGIWLIEATMEAPPSTAAKVRRKEWAGVSKIGRRELIEFCTLMSFQTRVGIPLIQSLEMAGQDCH